MPLNTSTFPAKSQRLLQQWGTSPSAQQDSHPPSAASELEERRVGSQVPPEQLCWATHQPWPTREWPFGKKVQVVWEICHLKQHLGLAFLQGKLSAMTGGSLVFFLLPAWSQNDILSHNCCFRHSTGPIHVTQIRNIYWSCDPHM